VERTCEPMDKNRIRGAADRGDEGPNERESWKLTRIGEVRPQMSEQLELPFERRGEAPRVERSVETSTAPGEKEGSGTTTSWDFPGSVRNLNFSNRRMRTRMSGGVGGE